MSGIELYERAVSARDAGRWDEAADLFERAFDAGHAVAGLDLALGLSAQRHHASAEAWCRRAADSGVAEAAFEVGCIERRRGDLDAAERWYRKAADGGDVSGMVSLGALLEERGHSADAMDVYRHAWDHGAHEAAFNLGRIIDDAGRDDADQAAERGNGAAFYNLGHSYAVSSTAGSRTVTRSPPSARGERVTVPSCACAMLLTIARPRPTPAWLPPIRPVPR
jgi:TPR repeat protein